MPKGAILDVRDLQKRNCSIYAVMRAYTSIKKARLPPNHLIWAGKRSHTILFHGKTGKDQG